MANYDAEIRVGTKVDTSQMQKLQIRIDKATEKVSRLAKKYEEVKKNKIPTDDFSILERKILGAKQELESFAEMQKKLSERGIGDEVDKDIAKIYGNIQILKSELRQAIDYGDQDTYLRLEERLGRAKAALQKMLSQSNHSLGEITLYELNERQLESAKVKVESLTAEMQKLANAGKAFKIESNLEEVEQVGNELSRAEAELRALNTQQEELNNKQKKSKNISKSMKNEYKELVSVAGKAFAALTGGIQSALGKVRSAAKKAFSTLNKGAEKSNGLFATMSSRLKGIALSLLIFNQITKAFNAMVSSIKEGITEFAKYSKDCNAVVSEFKSSLLTLKYNLGAAFAPIIQVVIPYLTAFINTLNSVISKISQFFAVLTGSSSYYKAVKQQVDFAGSLEDTANAAKEAAGALAGFDKLNVIKQNDNTGDSSGGGSSSDSEFEEVPVENGIKKLAEKVKEILAKLFAPLQEAWEREGKFVMESWRSALDEVWALTKDIGRDFLIMWNQEETVDIFADILHIIGDIGLVVAALAGNFRLAWNENKTGLHILENIRDIFSIIVANIRKAADYTVDWAGTLNFTPLLTSFEKFTRSLAPAVDAISGILSDFYTQVLLPLAGWTVEKGLPDLLQVFTDFNNRVNWEEIRSRLSEFWKHLEPFAETVGEGLIIFIDNLSRVIEEFTKSEIFKKFIELLEEKMDNATPESIARGLEKIAKALIFFKGAAFGLKALTTIAPAVTTIKSLMSMFAGGRGTTVAGEMTTVAGAAGKLQSSLGMSSGVSVMFLDFFNHHKEMRNTSDALEDNFNKMRELNEQLENGTITMEEFNEKRKEIIAEGDTIFKVDVEVDENGINKKLSGFIEKIAGFFTTDTSVATGAAMMGTGIGTALIGGVESSTSGLPKTINGISSALTGSGVTALKSAGETSGKAFSDGLEGSGKNIGAAAAVFGVGAVTGFNNGITENVKNSNKTVQEWMKSVQKSIHNSDMKFGSPSKTSKGFGKDTVTGYNEGITQNIAKTVAVIRTYMQTIQNTFRGIVSIMSAIGKNSIDALIQGLTSRQEELKKTVANIAKLMEEAARLSVGTASKASGSGATKSVKSAARSINIPQLATGGVIRGGNPFLAVLGDQPAGRTNVEAPLSTIKQALKEAMREAGGLGGGTIELNVNLTGKQIHKEVVNVDRLYKKSTGHSAFV